MANESTQATCASLFADSAQQICVSFRFCFTLLFFLVKLTIMCSTKVVNYRIYIRFRMLLELQAYFSYAQRFCLFEYIESQINPVHMKCTPRKQHIFSELFKFFLTPPLSSFKQSFSSPNSSKKRKNMIEQPIYWLLSIVLCGIKASDSYTQ